MSVTSLYSSLKEEQGRQDKLVLPALLLFLLCSSCSCLLSPAPLLVLLLPPLPQAAVNVASDYLAQQPKQMVELYFRRGTYVIDNGVSQLSSSFYNSHNRALHR